MVFSFVFLICLAAGANSDSGNGVMAILAGLFIGSILQLCWSDGKSKVNDKTQYRKMINDVKKQEKYDNEWGIIDWEDR